MRTFRSALFLAVLASLLLAAGGCYRYVPTEPSGVTRGTEVRARLTAAGEEEMRRLFGPGALYLDGDLVRWDDEGLAVLKTMTLQAEGYPSTEATDTIRLAPAHFTAVERKELDGRKTVWFSAAVVGGMAGALLASNVFGGGAEEGEEEGGGEEPEAALVWLSIPFSIFR